MLDESTLAFSAIRIIEIVKVLNWILAFCLSDRSHSHNVLERIFYSKITSPLFSILNTDRMWMDFLGLNTIVYQTLYTLEKIVRIKAFQSSSVIQSFSFYSFTLIFILGGLSNFMTEFVMERPIHGMNGSLAACLGYSLQVSSNRPLVTLLDVELKPGEILSYVFLAYLTHILLMDSRQSIGSMLSWVIGAIGGFSLYELQVLFYSRSRFI